MENVANHLEQKGGFWRVIAVRRSDGQQVAARFFYDAVPSREQCARTILAALDSRHLASPGMVRGFGDIALLRVHGYEFLSVDRIEDAAPLIAQNSQGANPTRTLSAQA
jgi:hypothetical protein